MTQLEQEQIVWFQDSFESLVDNVSRIILGKRHPIELAFTTLISEGHLLLEDVPGTGKTRLAKTIAASVRGVSSRIQFTPDLLPSDITGTTVYDQNSKEFQFYPGPIFANIVLADEINRASPKTQSALLEVMEEKQVTVDGTTHPALQPFLVIATQNPIEQAGTYRLPEAQLDRFMLRTSLGYPDHAATIEILATVGFEEQKVKEIVSLQGIEALTKLAKQVYLDPKIVDYIARIVDATRKAPQVRLGASMRAAVALTRATKTWALAKGRGYATPDDVKTLAEPVLAHRIVIEPEAEFDGVKAGAILRQILLDTPPPAQVG